MKVRPHHPYPNLHLLGRPSRWVSAFVLAAGLGAGTAAEAGPGFTSLVVLGDSLSDGGNNAAVLGADPTQVVTGNSYIPVLPYASGTYSNGPVWVTSLAASLGLPGAALPSSLGGGNFAFGGASTTVNGPFLGGVFPPSLKSQLGLFASTLSGPVPSTALFVVAGGGNDARDATVAAAALVPGSLAQASYIAAQASAYAKATHDIVDGLQLLGAQNIVVWNTPNIGLAPALAAQGAGASFLGASVSQAFNFQLTQELAGESGVIPFDIFGLLSATAVGTNGLVNVTDACGALGAACDPSTYLFWDGLHPTSKGHAIIAGAMLAAVPEPSTSLMLAAGALCLIGLRRRLA